MQKEILWQYIFLAGGFYTKQESGFQTAFAEKFESISKNAFQQRNSLLPSTEPATNLLFYSIALPMKTF